MTDPEDNLESGLLERMWECGVWGRDVWTVSAPSAESARSMLRWCRDRPDFDAYDAAATETEGLECTTLGRHNNWWNMIQGMRCRIGDRYRDCVDCWMMERR